LFPGITTSETGTTEYRQAEQEKERCQMTQRKEYERLQVVFFLNIWKELGTEVTSDSLLLDFGCGEGWVVYHYRKDGIKAFGVDIENRYSNVQQACKEEEIIKGNEDILRTIAMSSYRIPFEGNTFDVVISDQVFEHVQNYPEALAEIKRVLKPRGSGLHVIPSRYPPIEGHVFVPLATIFQGYAYLAFWAFLGIRNSFQKGLGWKEVAHLNYEYLNNHTTYYTKSKSKKLITRQFGNVPFVEATFIKHQSGRIHRYLYPLSRRFPFISSVFCALHSRVVFFKKQETSADRISNVKRLEVPA
jgi:SAM-dependent methyltransferase